MRKENYLRKDCKRDATTSSEKCFKRKSCLRGSPRENHRRKIENCEASKLKRKIRQWLFTLWLTLGESKSSSFHSVRKIKTGQKRFRWTYKIKFKFCIGQDSKKREKHKSMCCPWRRKTATGHMARFIFAFVLSLPQKREGVWGLCQLFEQLEHRNPFLTKVFVPGPLARDRLLPKLLHWFCLLKTLSEEFLKQLWVVY